MAGSKELDDIAEALRGVFQEILRGFVKTKPQMEALAKVLGKSSSHIKQMAYTGTGGLDSWTKAFAYLYKLDANALTNLKDDLVARNPGSEADKVWFSIKSELGANEEERYLIAKCAYESYRIAQEIEEIKKKSPKRRGPKPK